MPDSNTDNTHTKVHISYRSNLLVLVMAMEKSLIDYNDIFVTIEHEDTITINNIYMVINRTNCKLVFVRTFRPTGAVNNIQYIYN